MLVCSTCALAQNTILPERRRYKVIGAGLAGIAATYHLLCTCSRLQIKADVCLSDFIGVAGGASGVAAGLLHPYSPRGKLLWRGKEALSEVQELLRVAEDVSKKRKSDSVFEKRGLLFEARDEKQERSFKSLKESSNLYRISTNQAANFLPNLHFQKDHSNELFGLYIPEGIVLRPKPYLENLCRHCGLQQLAAESKGLLRVEFSQEFIASIEKHREQNGPFDGFIISAGAAVGCINELTNLLPLRLCQGATISLTPSALSEEGQYPAAAPSLLGSIYLASHSPTEVVIGATKNFGLNDLESLQEFSRNSQQAWDPTYRASVESYLHRKGQEIWEPLCRWSVRELRTGVRALPPMTQLGALPLLGYLPPDIWIISGLGSRGILYHAFLGKIISEAALSNDPGRLPVELRSWKKKI